MKKEWLEIIDNGVDEWRSTPDLYHNLSDLTDTIAERIRDEGSKLNLKNLEAIENHTIKLWQSSTKEGKL